MFRRTFSLARLPPKKGKQEERELVCNHTSYNDLECFTPCRNYTTNILTEINLKMFRVLDDSSARNLASRTTISLVLKLAQELRQSGESFNSETYEHILSAYSKGDQDNSIELADEMESQGIKPSRTFYHKALQVKDKVAMGFIIYLEPIENSWQRDQEIPPHKQICYIAWPNMDTNPRQRHFI